MQIFIRKPCPYLLELVKVELDLSYRRIKFNLVLVVQMGLVGDALFQSAQAFGLDGSTGIFLGFIFLTVFCGFIPLVVSFAINGKKTKEATLNI